MKKFLVLLLIATLAAFVFAGCTPPAEGEGEGEGEVEGVVVEIDGAVEIGGKSYIADGLHDITVTFPAPVANANVYITDCTGYYGKAYYDYYGKQVVLWPNADKTVWTGSGDFECRACYPDPCDYPSPCCASYVNVVAGECEGNVCVQVPVIVDCLPPYARLKVTVANCVCEGCEITFESTKKTDTCKPGLCCGDNCSGFAGGSIAIYKKDPFDTCCDTPCYEPFDSCAITECPIKCSLKCLDGGDYYVVVTLEDNVGNKITWAVILKVTCSENAQTGEKACSIVVEPYVGRCDEVRVNVTTDEKGNFIFGNCGDTGEWVS